MTEWVRFTNLLELEELARERLEPLNFDYIAGGSEDEVTLRHNRLDYDRLVLRPRVLVDVSRVDTSTTVLGTPVKLPVLIAPAAAHKMCCPDGELATARAAAGAGTIMVLSTMSTSSLEEVASTVAAPRWFQLYVYKDRGVTRQLVQRAEAAGYTALCLTVDVPFIGRRERDIRNNFAYPREYPLANFADIRFSTLPDGVEGSALQTYISASWDPSLTWESVDWLASITRLPVVLKGILTGEDAALGVEHGASAIVVSNHGGRQLDCAPSGIAALPEVVEAVDGRVEVLMDGGVRRGTDVLKALALGARAVQIGRPYMFALAVDGERGVRRAIDLLREELALAMALCGKPTVAAVDSSVVKVAASS